MKTLNEVKERLSELEERRKSDLSNNNAELTATRDALERLKEDHENAPAPKTAPADPFFIGIRP